MDVFFTVPLITLQGAVQWQPAAGPKPLLGVEGKVGLE